MGANDSYISIVEVGTSGSGKTLIWDVHEEPAGWPKKSILGTIKWYAPWRKYAFFPAPTTLFEEKCMGEISDFIKDQTDRHMGRGAYRR